MMGIRLCNVLRSFEAAWLVRDGSGLWSAHFGNSASARKDDAFFLVNAGNAEPRHIFLRFALAVPANMEVNPAQSTGNHGLRAAQEGNVTNQCKAAHRILRKKTRAGYNHLTRRAGMRPWTVRASIGPAQLVVEAVQGTKKACI
jgi:hypothetical protein